MILKAFYCPQHLLGTWSTRGRCKTISPWPTHICPPLTPWQKFIIFLCYCLASYNWIILPGIGLFVFLALIVCMAEWWELAPEMGLNVCRLWYSFSPGQRADWRQFTNFHLNSWSDSVWRNRADRMLTNTWVEAKTKTIFVNIIFGLSWNSQIMAIQSLYLTY